MAKKGHLVRCYLNTIAIGRETIKSSTSYKPSTGKLEAFYKASFIEWGCNQMLDLTVFNLLPQSLRDQFHRGFSQIFKRYVIAC